jgi:hypothetical protein
MLEDPLSGREGASRYMAVCGRRSLDGQFHPRSEVNSAGILVLRHLLVHLLLHN